MSSTENLLYPQSSTHTSTHTTRYSNPTTQSTINQQPTSTRRSPRVSGAAERNNLTWFSTAVSIRIDPSPMDCPHIHSFRSTQPANPDQVDGKKDVTGTALGAINRKQYTDRLGFCDTIELALKNVWCESWRQVYRVKYPPHTLSIWKRSTPVCSLLLDDEISAAVDVGRGLARWWRHNMRGGYDARWGLWKSDKLQLANVSRNSFLSYLVFSFFLQSCNLS